MHMAVFLPVPPRQLFPSGGFDLHTSMGRGFAGPFFFGYTSAAHMRDAASRAISTVASYPIPFVMIVTLSFPLNR
jgi:hypothetical protein